MSQKKGSKPIRITLTEDQISDIIQSAAKTRRSLSAQSLEDRIAPSAILGPLDPGLVDPGSQLPNLDPNDPSPLMDPNAGLLPGDPPPPEGFILPPTGSDPSNLNTPPLPPPYSDPPFLGTTPPVGDQAFTVPVPPTPDMPGLNDPSVHHGQFLPGAQHPGGSIMPPADGPDPAPVPPVDSTPPSGPGMPTPEEIAEHRRNILRQLRGI
jgi:hypothetical protein